MAEEFNKEALLTQIKGLIDESKNGVVTEKELNKRIDNINEQLKELNSKDNNHEEVKALKDSVANLLEATQDNTAAIKAMVDKANNPKPEAPKTFRAALEEAVMEKKDIVLTEKNDDFGKRLSLKEYFTEKGNQTSPTFTVKAAVDMLVSNIAQPKVPDIRLTELDPQRVGIPLTIYPHVMMWVPSKRIKRPTMSILVVYTYEDGSGTKTEGSASSKSSFLLKTVEFKSFFIATHFTLSDETLDDLDEVMDEISVTAPSKILDKVDTKVLGTTGDDSTDIAGLYTSTKHTDFATATYTDTQENASIIDLVSKAKLQCEGNKYLPDAVVMNPSDIEKLSGLQNAFEDSKLDRRMSYDNIGQPTFIKGLRIIASTAQAANTLAVIDSKQLMMGIRNDMTMEIGYNGTDLTEGQKTVVLKLRVAFGVRDKAGVIYSSNITTDVEAINKVGA